jgi:arginase
MRVPHEPQDDPVVMIGIPAALGGWWPELADAIVGMTQAPAGMRRLGIVDRIRAADAAVGARLTDVGDVPIDPGFRADTDPVMKNRDLLLATLPGIREHVAGVLAAAGPDARLLALGGECTIHAANLAAIRRARPDHRTALVWFDAHGDFNTPETMPGGSVWGMPFAIACGRGDASLLAACDAPSVLEEDCALMGGQVLDELESRAIAASRVAHFGAGMLRTDAGLAAFVAWARVVSRRVDGFYVAFDVDCLDASGGWAVTLQEPGGLSVETAVQALRALAAIGPVVGFGASTVSLGNGDAPRTVDAVATLATAALGD